MERLALLLIIFICLSFPARAQKFESTNAIHENWLVGFNGGASYLLTEVRKNFSQVGMDMNSLANRTYNGYFGKRLSRKWELGVTYGQTYFNGFRNFSAGVNWFMYGEQYRERFKPYALYYDTHINNTALEVKYNYLNLYSPYYNFLNAHFYLKYGLGVTYIHVDVGYKDDNHYLETGLKKPLFEKGKGMHPGTDSYLSHSLGFGLSTNISHRFSIMIETTLLLVSADYLDGVHNFKVIDTPTGKGLERTEVLGVVTQFRFGIAYQFDLKFMRKVSTANAKYPWLVQKDYYRNDFYYDKKYNRILHPELPFSDQSMRKGKTNVNISF